MSDTTPAPRLEVRKHGRAGGKAWHVLRPGYTLPLGSFYDWPTAQRYADKLCTLNRRGAWKTREVLA